MHFTPGTERALISRVRSRGTTVESVLDRKRQLGQTVTVGDLHLCCLELYKALRWPWPKSNGECSGTVFKHGGRHHLANPTKGRGRRKPTAT